MKTLPLLFNLPPSWAGRGKWKQENTQSTRFAIYTLHFNPPIHLKKVSHLFATSLSTHQNFKIGTENKSKYILLIVFRGCNPKEIRNTFVKQKVFLWISISSYKTHIKTAHSESQTELLNDWFVIDAGWMCNKCVNFWWWRNG